MVRDEKRSRVPKGMVRDEKISRVPEGMLRDEKGMKFQWDEEGSKKNQYQGARPRVARNRTVL